MSDHHAKTWNEIGRGLLPEAGSLLPPPPDIALAHIEDMMAWMYPVIDRCDICRVHVSRLNMVRIFDRPGTVLCRWCEEQETENRMPTYDKQDRDHQRYETDGPARVGNSLVWFGTIELSILARPVGSKVRSVQPMRFFDHEVWP